MGESLMPHTGLHGTLLTRCSWPFNTRGDVIPTEHNSATMPQAYCHVLSHRCPSESVRRAVKERIVKDMVGAVKDTTGGGWKVGHWQLA